jgi:ABC-type amino acid transport substrate-binding protein
MMSLARPLAAALALAAVSAPRADGAPPLRVAMSGNYPPLHTETENGGREGLEADLALELGTLVGRPVRFVGRKELGVGDLEAVAAGKADVALASITPTPERRRLVEFTRPYLELRFRLAAADPDAPGASAGRRVAVPRGPAAAAARGLLAGATVVETPGLDQAAQLVTTGAADLLFAEDVAVALASLTHPLHVIGAPIGRSPIAMAVPKGEAARWDEALAKLSPRIAQLVEKYQPGTPAAEVVHIRAADAGATTFRVRLSDLTLEKGAPRGGAARWHEFSRAFSIDVAPVRRGSGLPPRVLDRYGDAIYLDSPAWAQLAGGAWVVAGRSGPICDGPDGECPDIPLDRWWVAVIRGEAIWQTEIRVP